MSQTEKDRLELGPTINQEATEEYMFVNKMHVDPHGKAREGKEMVAN